MLTYDSPFDHVTTDDLKRFYTYKGSVDRLINELQDKPTIPILIYHPVRIIKGLIDYKIKHPEKTIIHSLIRYMTELTKEIYSIKDVQIFKLSNFKLMLEEHDMKDFLSFEITQDEDSAACFSSIGRLTQRTAQRLFSHTQKGGLVIIPMAHGATPSGIDLLLRYNILVQNNASVVYPCRFSAHKESDLHPNLDQLERLYLQSQAKNKTIVIFEENVITGITLKKASEFFQNEVFPDKTVMTITNLDISKTVAAESDTRKNHEEMLKQFLLQYEDPTS